MIKIEKTEVVGWEHAIRGMRNPKNSWGRMDSVLCGNTTCDECKYFNEPDCPGHLYSLGDLMYGEIGPNDHKLMMGLASGGPVHAKYRRMITVYMDVTAPLYWWKEFDTYKIGTVANSCSTMHKIHDKEFTLDDFSCEHLWYGDDELEDYIESHKPTKPHWAAVNPMHLMNITLGTLNYYREKFLETKDKKYWWQMIQLLPSSYNQKRTIMLNYEVLHNIYISRKDHKLDEWHVFCDWIESLPYSEIITGKNINAESGNGKKVEV